MAPITNFITMNTLRSLRVKHSWKENVEIFFHRFFHNLKYNFYYAHIYYPLQKLIRGYSDPEWYSFDYYHSKYVIPRLKHLRNNINAWPAQHPEFPAFEDWQKVLDEMIWAFEFNLKMDDLNYTWKYDENDQIKRMETGLALFAKYYRHLWD